jgi:phospholipid/cholesterol/gamma-HCH transport system permease protein
MEKTHTGPLGMVEDIGSSVLNVFQGLGSFTIFSVNAMLWTMRPPFRFSNFTDQMYFVGNKSFFIIVLTSVFSGMVFAYQTFLGFQIINGDSLVGPVVAISIAKELAPVLTGVVVAGRCGAAMAAEIGTMKVTEQVDALEVMGVSSIQYLAVPRIWATALSLPLLTVIFMFVANLGSYLIGVYNLGIEESMYFAKLGDFMSMSNIYEGLIKATIFGFLIALIGTYHGFQVKGGAEGVGKGTNLAVVWGMITVLVLDFFITSILVHIL